MIAIRLLIVDDHPIMRDGLRGVFSDDPASRSSARSATGPKPSGWPSGSSARCRDRCSGWCDVGIHAE